MLTILQFLHGKAYVDEHSVLQFGPNLIWLPTVYLRVVCKSHGYHFISDTCMRPPCGELNQCPICPIDSRISGVRRRGDDNGSLRVVEVKV